MIKSISAEELIRFALDVTELDKEIKVMAINIALIKHLLHAKLGRPFLNSLDVRRQEFADKYNLSQDEIKTLCLVAEGMTNKEIAEKLNLAPDTIKARVSNILWKTQKRSRKQLIVMAWKTDLNDQAPNG